MSRSRHHIVLFTGQDIGFDLVNAIQARGDASLLVITMRTVRDDLNGYRSAIDACHMLGIPVLVTSRPDDAAVEQVRAFSPDVILSAYYPYRIPPEVSSIARLGTVNLHPGILPFYRGKFPTPWYILNGESEFGLALHRIVDDGIDTGPVLVQARYPLPVDMTGHELLRATMREGAALLLKNLSAILAGSLTGHVQPPGGSYYSNIEKRFQIDWNASVSSIDRRIRVHAKPYLPAFSYMLNLAVYVNRAHPVEFAGFTAQGGGIIMERREGCVIVSCADGCLSLDEYEVYPQLSPAEQQFLFQIGRRFE